MPTVSRITGITGDERVEVVGDRLKTVSLATISGTPTVQLDGPITATISGTPTVTVSGFVASGRDMRYEKQGNVSLPKVSKPHATVYEITEESVFYKIVFQLDSDNIYIQVEIDGQDIFPASNGLLFGDLEDLCLGASGEGGYYYSNNSEGGNAFGLYQYGSNKWIWEPPVPLHVVGNMKVKMKASNNSKSKDYLKGFAIRRSLV